MLDRLLMFEMSGSPITRLAFGFQALLAVHLLYHVAISIAGWGRRRRLSRGAAKPTTRFAVVVAAHNEAPVIAETVRSVKAAHYPPAFITLHVIADNCTDETAAVARAAGATVHERHDTVRRGKGHALQWLLETLLVDPACGDAVCVLDADNLMHPDFLYEMDAQLTLGHDIVQGYLDSKNPGDSWIAACYAMAYWVSNRLFQFPRAVLGLSCALGGTGFVVRTTVLRELGWGDTCLTEDLEFSVRVVLSGRRVAWAHDAIVYDEKPLTLHQSWTQRTRWMQGHWDCATLYGPLLLRAVWRAPQATGDARGRWRLLDMVLYLFQPLSTLVSVVLLSVAVLTQWEGVAIQTALSLVVLMAAPLVITAAERRPMRGAARYLVWIPLFAITWIPIIVQGFRHRHRRAWAHTLHTRAVSLHDLTS